MTRIYNLLMAVTILTSVVLVTPVIYLMAGVFDLLDFLFRTD